MRKYVQKLAWSCLVIWSKPWFKRLTRPWQKIMFLLCAGTLLLFYFCLPRSLFPEDYSTAVYDRQGNLLGARVSAQSNWCFPPSEVLPEKYIVSLIAFEDQYFYYHLGVNPVSLMRAFRSNLKAGKVLSGGSTLTMQTIRLARKKKRTLFEKIKESILAVRLELRYSKRSILKLYASHAPFGGNIVGIEAASWRFYGHSFHDLSWAEAALLAVLPNSPSSMHLERNRTSLLEKRNRLLTKLHKKGHLDEQSLLLAIEEPIPDGLFPLPQLAPHLVSNLNRKFPGKSCRTSVNIELQVKLERMAKYRQEEFAQNKINDLAVIVWDVQKSEVVAYCGNANYQNHRSGYQVDIIQALRSSGSTLKPFLYHNMLKNGALLPDMLVADIPIIQDGFRPQNYSQTFEGAVKASRALSRSLNLPAVNMLKSYGVPRFLDELREMGLSTLIYPSDHYGLSLILGGGEVSLWELSQMYMRMAQAVLCNTEKQKREELYDWGQLPLFSKEKEGNAFSAAASWQTLEALLYVNRPEEMELKNVSYRNRVAWKTGTSYGFRDAWAIGVTPQYVVGVWVGNADGEGRPGLTGTATAALMMFDVFNLFPSTAWFSPPYQTLTKAELCHSSGCLAGPNCEQIDTVFVLPEGLRTEVCPYHTQVYLTENKRYRAFRDCYPASQLQAEKWFQLPPVQEWYYKQKHPEYKEMPPIWSGCDQSETNKQMEFIYPTRDTPIRLSKQLDGSYGDIVLELAHRQENAVVYWHLDDAYLTTTKYFHQVSILPNVGIHTITVVDEAGNSLKRKIEVRFEEAR